MQIRRFDEKENIVTYDCPCGKQNKSTISEFKSIYLEEFNEYSNLNLKCPECNLLHIINLNLPIGEMDEYDLEKDIMPYHEINQRKYIRDIMWNKRVDLKQLNREEHNA